MATARSLGNRISVQRCKEVVALIVDDNEGGEVLDLDAPNGFHAQLRVFDHFHFLDAVLRKPRGWPTDRAEIKSAMLLARLGDLPRAVALGQQDQASAGALELIDIGVHATRRCRSERT